jgi:hypothetical protein
MASASPLAGSWYSSRTVPRSASQTMTGSRPLVQADAPAAAGPRAQAGIPWKPARRAGFGIDQPQRRLDDGPGATVKNSNAMTAASRPER